MSEAIPAALFEFHVARSEFLDAQASAELAVRHRLAKLGQKSHPTLCQNIDAATKIKAAPQYSRKEKADVDAALVALKDLQEVQCDIVHGTMSVVTFECERVACFINVQKVGLEGRIARLMTIQDLRSSARRLREAACAIEPHT